MHKQTIFAIAIAALLIGGMFFLGRSPEQPEQSGSFANTALAAKFEELSQNGNSSCSDTFKDSITTMPDSARLQGSCCSPMSIHRYSEQVEGLQNFKTEHSQNIAEIPDDPYDISAELAKRLISYYDIELTPEEQAAYDYAMLNSSEKGPCCCRCWRWYVYGGLAKFLIQNHGFTGEQITELWNLSGGCGGDNEHHH
ncbi:MAG: hypothetical protein A3B96_01810 [Candidatus Spechtbacteria bacterium RIFCSPHIGHO2_02_FULL_43_15b]|nr:MAG: hypothetical protein A3B96_01810 [Candidatus Spechtbacteria bacterium RIFCSPHIGHO2_02_FULL_43_15b]